MILIECISLPSANDHLPEPWKIGEKAIFIGERENDGSAPDSFFEQFIELKRLPSKSIQVEERKHFKFLTKK